MHDRIKDSPKHLLVSYRSKEPKLRREVGTSSAGQHYLRISEKEQQRRPRCFVVGGLTGGLLLRTPSHVPWRLDSQELFSLGGDLE